MLRTLIHTTGALLLVSLVTPVLAAAERAALPGSTLENGAEIFQISCPDNPQQTTLDMNACYGEMKAQVASVKDHYLTAIRQRLAEEGDEPAGQAREKLAAFEAENNAWDALEEKAAAATATYWQGGTIRGVMGASRAIQLIELRIHNQWENWLRYQDSTPALLPEPKFTSEGISP